MVLNEGTQLRDYTIVSKLGAGGMGEVWLAKDAMLERKVALKVLPPILTQDPTFVERFRHEAKLQASLRHPGIISVHSFFEVDNSCVIAMEYAEGKTLREVLHQSGAFNEVTAVNILRQLLEALNYAHSLGIVHRDIKPSNIIVDSQNNIRILDFGIAKILGEKGLTSTGAKMGSVYYMSPEQVKADKNIDSRSDIYSLGITFYEMLTAVLPFPSQELSDYEIMEHVVYKPLPPIQERLPHLNPVLVGLIQGMTQKDKEQRFATCATCLQVLSGYSPGVGSIPPPFVPQQQRPLTDTVIMNTPPPMAPPPMQPMNTTGYNNEYNTGNFAQNNYSTGNYPPNNFPPNSNTGAYNTNSTQSFNTPPAKSSKLPFIIVLSLVSVALLSVLYIFVVSPWLKDYNAPRKYVFARNLFLRSTQFSGTDANILAKIPYASELKVYKEEGEWAEVKYGEQIGFVATEFIKTKKDFYEMDCILGNNNAKEIVYVTKQKKALKQYFDSKGYMGKMSDELQTEFYGEKQNKDVWQVFAEDKESEYNTAVSGNFTQGKEPDFACIIKSEFGKERLLVWSFYEGNPTLILERDLNVTNAQLKTLRKYKDHVGRDGNMFFISSYAPRLPFDVIYLKSNSGEYASNLFGFSDGSVIELVERPY